MVFWEILDFPKWGPSLLLIAVVGGPLLSIGAVVLAEWSRRTKWIFSILVPVLFTLFFSEWLAAQVIFRDLIGSQ
ncbi:MAG: hypothetical protein ACI9BW_002659 [Gammaproteobacteria bacterium]|jgi:hypothetical protein